MVESFTITRTGGKAIYLQIYEQILDDIRTHTLLPADQLPTEKHLSHALSVSRNTVGMAYRRLEQDGFVVSTPGRGTFVSQDASATSAPAAAQRDRIGRLFDLAVEEALSLGMTLEDYASLFRKHLSRQKRKIRDSRICLIECNEEQLMIFGEDIQKAIGISITPILLADFRARRPETMQKILCADIAMTSVYHSSEVVSLLPEKRIDVVGLQPQLDSLIQIAQLPHQARVAIVCKSRQFSGDIINTLKESKLSFPNLSVTESDDEQILAKQIADMDAVIASPGRIHDVRRLNAGGIPVIEFVYRISSASMNMIKTLIVENERKSNAPGRPAKPA